MTANDLLTQVKKSIRMTSAIFDEDELLPMINACLQDMKGAVGKVDDNNIDELTAQAVKFYCKANFGENENAERWTAAYEKLRDAIALRGEKNG